MKEVCTLSDHSGIKACEHCKIDTKGISSHRRRPKRKKDCIKCGGRVAVCKICEMPLPV
jgi:hypothetical protein